MQITNLRQKDAENILDYINTNIKPENPDVKVRLFLERKSGKRKDSKK